MVFVNDSSAASATITIDPGGALLFADRVTAANSHLIVESGGMVNFESGPGLPGATAGSARVITNGGGRINFTGLATGGSAAFVTNVGGVFDMSGLTSSGMTSGSIAGGGNYFLGSANLTTGLDNTKTTVSGVIQDGGTNGGAGGSLTKVGTGALTLTGVNTYTGGTKINVAY